MSRQLPTLPRLIIQRGLAKEECEFALGDLAEEFERRAARGSLGARLWLWRQVRLSVLARGAEASGASHAKPGDGDEHPRPRPRADSLSGLVRDFRYAARGLRTQPTLTLVAVLTLALGIGATTAIFTMVDGIVLRPLSLADADRIVLMRNHYADGRPGEWNSSFPQYLDFQEQTSSFDELAAWQSYEPALAADDGGPALRMNAVGATWNLFPLLGVEPSVGRAFRPEEDAAGAGTPVALLSHALWRSRFGADEGVIGRQIRLDERPYTIIGVLPQGFSGSLGGGVLPAAPVDLWMTFRNSATNEGVDQRGLRITTVVGKLMDGVTLQQAQEDVRTVAAGLSEQYPEAHTGEGTLLRPALEAVVGWVRPILWTLFGAVALVLLIACANVANLLLGRAANRRHEVAVRMALGAGRGRLLRLAMAESVLLGLLGGVLAGPVAATLLGASRLLAGDSVPRLAETTIGFNTAVFAAAIALAAGVVLGAVPALHGTRGQAAGALRSASRSGTPGRGGGKVRGTLVVAEVAMAVVLLVGAGLLLRSFDQILRVDPGFRPDNVLTAYVRLSMPFVDRENWPRAVAFFEEATSRLEALPGVEAAAAAYQLPTSGGWTNAFGFADRPDPADGDSPSAVFRPVTPGYFELAGIGLERGRTFADSDHADAPRVAIVNQEFVRQYFTADQDPLGARLEWGNWWAGGPPEYEVVGVVEDVYFGGRSQGVYPAAYFPHAQQPVREMSLMVRTRESPMDLAGALRAEIAAIDPQLPVDSISTLEQGLADDEVVRRAVMTLGAFFALTALSLAAIGVYGIMSFAVAQRTRELGIRMALGARGNTVRGMVLRRGLRVVSVGLLLGIAAAAAAGRLIQGLLFEVTPADPVTYVGVSLFLLGVALIACWIPARRATRVDPMISLRSG